MIRRPSQSELKPAPKPASVPTVFRTQTPIVVDGRQIRTVEVTRDFRQAPFSGSTMRMRPCTNYVLLGRQPAQFRAWQRC
jgi:hypothetical protein